jgi:hypothetical protein
MSVKNLIESNFFIQAFFFSKIIETYGVLITINIRPPKSKTHKNNDEAYYFLSLFIYELIYFSFVCFL